MIFLDIHIFRSEFNALSENLYFVALARKEVYQIVVYMGQCFPLLVFFILPVFIEHVLFQLFKRALIQDTFFSTFTYFGANLMLFQKIHTLLL